MTCARHQTALPVSNALSRKTPDGGGETMQVRWETASRYYEVRLERDLLDDWVLLVARGGRWSRLGALQTIFVLDEAEGLRKIEKLHKVRRRRGYVEVPCVSFYRR
jgi:predicted DNA-binding WGR domain protein